MQTPTQKTIQKTAQFMQPFPRLQSLAAHGSRIGLTSISLAIIASLSAHASIPVESRPLSQPAAPVVSTDSNQASQLWLLTQKIQKLEEDVRILRGKVESHDNDIDQLQKDAKNHFVDFDQRLGQVQDDVKKLQGGSAPIASNSTNPPTQNTATSNTTPQNPVAGNGTATTDEADKVAYIAAYEAYKTGGAAQAIAPMKKFINDYPQSQFVPNAYYWLGEFNLAVNPPNFAAATTNFKIVTGKYPKSAKAAAATYRLATLADVDQHQAAAIALMKTLVKNYPGTQEAGFATDYLKSHATATVDKKSETDKSEKSDVKKTDSKKTEKVDKTQSHKVEATEKHKKPVKKVKDSDNGNDNT
ncbi:MAG: tetratricopeptide repeat protein [Gammaproteobacteria bacterium]|nr:tetratricopeptide repeat protein [Gammaproteobacteria bacterium]